MQILGYKYRSDLPSRSYQFSELSNPDLDNYQSLVGYHKDSGLPVNDLNYVEDSRFVGVFKTPSSVPSCPSESVLKPTSVETFSEQEKFCSYLVSEIDSASEEIKRISDKQREELIEAARSQVQNENSNVE